MLEITDQSDNNLDKNHLDKLREIRLRPVFILGLNRSGTSILYKMLVETDCFNPVTIYHIVFYNQLLYNHINGLEQKIKEEFADFLIKNELTNRGIDRLKLNIDFAEEYGFLLGKITFVKKIKAKNIDNFVQLCKKIVYLSENNKPILLKNPMDFSNFLFIKDVFPNAKFIFIHRNPINVLSSTISALKKLFEKRKALPKNIFKYYTIVFDYKILLKTIRFFLSYLFPIIPLIIIFYTKITLNYYLKNIGKLSEKDYVRLTYEDLCKNPQKNMNKIINFLDLEVKENINFSEFIKPRKTKIDPAIFHMRKFIYRCMKRYFKKFNYKP